MELQPVSYDIMQGALDTGELVTVLLLRTPDKELVTLWEGGALVQMVHDLEDVDACTRAGIVLGTLTILSGAPGGYAGVQGPSEGFGPSGATEGWAGSQGPTAGL